MEFSSTSPCADAPENKRQSHPGKLFLKASTWSKLKETFTFKHWVLKPTAIAWLGYRCCCPFSEKKRMVKNWERIHCISESQSVNGTATTSSKAKKVPERDKNQKNLQLTKTLEVACNKATSLQPEGAPIMMLRVVRSVSSSFCSFSLSPFSNRLRC